MKTLTKLLAAIPTLLFVVACNGQIKNAKIVHVNIDGNCETCEKTIESAAFIKKTADADWDKDKKTAVLTFDSTKTNSDEILKRVAYAGYDNEKYLAPDMAYNKLPGCCKYDRVRKQKSIPAVIKKEPVVKETKTEQIIQSNQFTSVFESYFALKNAFVKSDRNQVSLQATQLSTVLGNVDMLKLEHTQHEVWMRVYKQLIAKSKSIAKSKNIEDQRHQFMGLSEGMYQLAKISKIETPVYFQNCPMYNDGKGANWLSEESSIKNPYYGSKMLSCGSTKETIK